MQKVEFMPAGKDKQTAIEFVCKLTGSLYLGEEQDISVGSKINIRCESATEADIMNEKMWVYPKELVLPHNIANQNKEDFPILISYPGLKVDTNLYNILINLNPDLPQDIKAYKKSIQIIIEDKAELRRRAAESWKACIKANMNPELIKL
ncbi:MAG: DNA polymerase III subunit chi [SAR86 cluster bacterium]|jgi:DNA polymerase IIIc chi subunit|nr:DNA polymerase III subunit chi [SAR86 cluster bacterium]